MVKQQNAGDKRERSDDDSSEGDEGPQHDQMYAGVSNLFAACEATNATRPKRHRTEEEKKMERLSANRRSARESRNRKKLVFEELQRSVARLAEENASLRKENETTRAQMSALKRQFGLPDDSAAPAGVQGLAGAGQGGMGGVDLSQGLNLMQQQQGDNQGGGGVNMDQAQQLAMLEAAQQAQAQQQLQLAAAGLNPFAGNSLEGGGQSGGDGQGGDYQERLQLFQRRVEERSQLINQLKNSIGGGGGGMGGQGSNPNLEALRRQLQQQGQGGDKMPMGATGFS